MGPVRSKRSRDLEKRLYGLDISDITETDVICTAAYLFLVSKDRENLLDVQICCFLEKLADRLNLRDRLNLVMEKYVLLLENRNILKLYAPESNNNKDAETDAFGIPLRRSLQESSASDYKYEVDRNIERYCGQRLDENHKNYYRIMYTDAKGMISQIIYHTFFNKCLITPGFFHDELPANIKTILSDTSSLNFLKKELGLSDNETRYLLFRYRKLIVSQFAEVLDFFSTNSAFLYTTVLGITKKEFNQITRRDSKLRQFGFIDDNRDLNPEVADVIENKDLSIYFSDCIKKQDLENIHPLNTFSVPEKNTLIYKDLLKSKESVSLLLYGAPGSGKTEYAKSLAKSTGKKAIVFKNESEILAKDDILGRLYCLLSLNLKNTILIVDEADTLLSTSMESMFSHVQASKTKGVVNRMLELSKNKVIWIVNYKNQIDESTLRRFTVSYKFNAMSVSMLEKIAEKKLEKLELEGSTKKELLRLLSKYKVTGASVENLIRTVNCMKNKEGERIVENVEIVLKDNSSLLYGESKMRTHVKDSYDMTVLNTSLSSKKIMDMLYNAKRFADKNPGSGAVRMLFYGLSGTGKTEFARYISESLGKELLLKRASDIFDKYVGGTEQNIAAAFEEAAKNDQILLFDEADSFFSDRNNAERNFERTQVNEFLTQLEEFPGIVICTTNLRNIMDPAMLRRFHITVDFKALNKDGIEKLLCKFFKDCEFEDKLVSRLCEYNSVTPGDFGRLSDVIKFMDPEEVTAEYIIEQLCDIQEEKGGDCARGKKIGFCA